MPSVPPEHAATLCRCYEEKQSPLQEQLRACSLRGELEGRLGPLDPWNEVWGTPLAHPMILILSRPAVNRLVGVGWRVDYTLSSSLLRSVEEPVVQLRLEVAQTPGATAEPLVLTLSADKFQVLLAGEAVCPGGEGPSSLSPSPSQLSPTTFAPAELKQANTLMSSLG